MIIETGYLLLTAIIAMSSTFAFLSYRVKNVQPTLSVFIASIVLAICIKLGLKFGPNEYQQILSQSIENIYFHDIVVYGLLSYLLFAGSLHISTTHFDKQLPEIITLAFAGTLIAVSISAILTYYATSYWMGVDFIACLLFAAAISPTDPVAVLALLKSVNVSKSIEVKIAGESLLNDGVGIVIFTTILEFAQAKGVPSLYNVLLFFAHEVFGGLILGYIIAKCGVLLFRNTNSEAVRKEDIVWTIALVNIAQFISMSLGVSPALCAVSLGLCLGRFFDSVPVARAKSLMQFWDIIDELLNFILFFLLGMEIIKLDIQHYQTMFSLGLIAITVTAIARYVSVNISFLLAKIWRNYDNKTKNIIALGGIKGGLSLALVSVIPMNIPNKSSVLLMTYSVVAFTIIVQSLLLQHYLKTLRNTARNTIKNTI